MLKTQKKGKLKRELLKILNWYDLSRVGPCEKAHPEDSKNVVVFEIWIGHTSSKSRVICPKAKKCLFRIFFVILPRKISSGCRSDNFDASGLPNSSSESLCPKVFRKHVKNAETLKIGGPIHLQSQLIRNRDTEKNCFFRQFFAENCFSRPNRSLLTI